MSRSTVDKPTRIEMSSFEMKLGPGPADAWFGPAGWLPVSTSVQESTNLPLIDEDQAVWSAVREVVGG